MTVTPFRAGGDAAGTGMSSHDIEALASTNTVLLADVSEFQPNVADAVYLAWSKAICIRAAYGDAHDDRAWYGGSRRAMLHGGGARFLGIYQYLVAGQDGTAQANAMHDLVGPLQPGEVLIADFEEGQHAMLTAWYNRMLALGYPDKYLWTYTGLNFGQANGALPVQWLAAYQLNEPASPHVLWQFTGSFTVAGIGLADCSVFHGSIDDLAALAYPGAQQPAGQAPGGTRQQVHPAPSAVSFNWDAVPKQGTYHFQLERYQGGFGWVLDADQQVSGTGITTGLAASTRYRWRVAATAWSDWTEFSTP